MGRLVDHPSRRELQSQLDIEHLPLEDEWVAAVLAVLLHGSSASAPVESGAMSLVDPMLDQVIEITRREPIRELRKAMAMHCLYRMDGETETLLAHDRTCSYW